MSAAISRARGSTRRSPNRIRLDEVADVLDPLFALFAEAREPGEGFGDFCHRYGVADLREVVLASRGKVKDAAD